MKKEKDKEKPMKLSDYDRTMATIRLPEYQQEYAEYARLLDIDKKKAEGRSQSRGQRGSDLLIDICNTKDVQPK